MEKWRFRRDMHVTGAVIAVFPTLKSLVNTVPTEIVNSNDIPASEIIITSDTSNSDDTSEPNNDTKSSLSVKGGQGLIQELFTPELSLQESNIIQNHVIEISETGGPGKSNIDEASQHLAQLCDKAFDAEDGANRANQEEILCWAIYGKDFRVQFNDIIKNSGGKIGEKKARSLLYDSITKQLSIIRKKRSQKLDNARHQNSETAVKSLPEEESSSANNFSCGSSMLILLWDNFCISGDFSTISISATQFLPGQMSRFSLIFSRRRQWKTWPQVNIVKDFLKKLPETEVSALPEKVSSEIQVNTSNKSRPPISTLPDDPEEKRKCVIEMALEWCPYLSLDHRII
ncbi:16586_t:CDS:2 [Entrophospora sp. SA101]|nr:16586_t:CDS:2 [Entrophospora sp. SA101]